MESVVLIARVTWDDERYLAKVDQLSLKGSAKSMEAAKDELIMDPTARRNRQPGPDPGGSRISRG